MSEEVEEEEEEESHPVRDAMKSAFQEDMQQAQENLITYGFDTEVVNAWFADKSKTWEELQKTQDQENAAQAQADTREAADYLKGIADNWVVGMGEKHDEEMAMMDEQLQGFIDELKQKIDDRAQENINKVDTWLNDTYNSVVSFTEQDMDVQPWEEDEVADDAVADNEIEVTETIALAQTHEVVTN